MRILRRIGPLILLLLLLFWALLRLDLRAFAQSIGRSHISLWVLAALLNVAIRAGARAERTRVLLRSLAGQAPHFLGLYVDLVSAQAATVLWPPAGMGFRLLVLRRRYGFGGVELVALGEGLEHGGRQMLRVAVGQRALAGLADAARRAAGVDDVGVAHGLLQCLRGGAHGSARACCRAVTQAPSAPLVHPELSP